MKKYKLRIKAIEEYEVEVEAETLFHAKAKSGDVELTEIKREYKEVFSEKQHRTMEQNDALHLYFNLLAIELNDHPEVSFRNFFKESYEIEFTANLVKEQIWRPIQKSITGKKSTTELERGQEIDKIYNIINKLIGEKYGIHVPFPNRSLLGYDDNNTNNTNNTNK